jgi:hypothetical protein
MGGGAGRSSQPKLPVLLPDAPGAPGPPPFMFWHWWAGFCVADGEGVAAAGLADPALTDVVAGVEDDVVDAEVVGCDVAALATAMLAPNPTPSAAAPTALPMMILPSLAFNVSAS